jgi:DNA-directed RNA polymerase specialized sigma24 family protein
MARNRENTAGTQEYAKFACRMLRAFGRRAGQDGGMDIDALRQLTDIQRELTEQTEQVVAALRGEGFSWAEIGEALGMDRSAAYRKYKHVEPEGARKPGGQPGHLR